MVYPALRAWLVLAWCQENRWRAHWRQRFQPLKVMDAPRCGIFSRLLRCYETPRLACVGQREHSVA